MLTPDFEVTPDEELLKKYFTEVSCGQRKREKPSGLTWGQPGDKIEEETNVLPDFEIEDDDE